MFKKCSVVMLPTNNEKAENCFIERFNYRLSFDKKYFTQEYLKYNQAKAYHLYILSDEKIKEGDWIFKANAFNDGRGMIKQAEKGVTSERFSSLGWLKIIATTDKSLTYYLPEDINKIGAEHNLPQPSQDFIQKFIEEYNKGNVITEITVEYNMVMPQFNGDRTDGKIIDEISLNPKDNTLSVIKINYSDNTINIKPIKDSWSREEVINLLKLQYNEFAAYPMMNLDLRDKWIEKNL